MLVLPLFASCREQVPAPVGPIPTRPDTLYAAYRDEPDRAQLAFTGQDLLVLISTFTTDGNDVLCHVLMAEPPILVLHFDRLPGGLRSPLWIRGVCQGRQPAGFVLIADCRVSEGPR